MNRLARALVSGALGLASAAQALGADAQPRPESVAFEADGVFYDAERDATVMEGDVEARGAGFEARARRLTYDHARGAAQGEDITLTWPESALWPAGSTLEADFGAFDWSAGSVRAEGVRAHLPGGARFVGARGALAPDGALTLEDVGYTACPVCEQGRALWSVRAKRLERDPARGELRLTSPVFAVFGVPVLWAPSIVQPDASVLRRASGLLEPRFENDEELGPSLTLPVFFAFGERADLTLDPTLYQERGFLMRARLRRATEHGGYLDLAGAYLAPQRNPEDATAPASRAALFGEGFARSTDGTTEARFVIQQPTDDAFPRAYDLTNRDVFVNALEVRRKAPSGALTFAFREFRDLRADPAEGDSPDLAPVVEWRGDGTLGALGGLWRARLNAARLRRESGARDSLTRFYAEAGWERAFAWRGFSARPFASLRAAAYDLGEAGGAGGPRRDHALPTLGLDLNAPFARPLASGGFDSLEARAQIIYAPVATQDDTPNEDSRAVEFDEANLFHRNRFSGLDRWEDGARLNLGLTWTRHFPAGGAASARIGQTLRLDDNLAFAPASGLRPESSDIVASFGVHAPPALALYAKARASPDGRLLQAFEIESRLELEPVGASAVYGWTRSSPGDGEEGEQLRASLRLGGAQARFSVEGSAAYDMRDRRLLDTRLAFVARHPCLRFGLRLKREIDDADEAKDSISISLALRAQGGF